MTQYSVIQPSGKLYSALEANQQKQPREYANISNESLTAFPDDLAYLQSLAQEIGVDLGKAGYTYCARQGKGTRSFTVYGPSVYAGMDGAPTLAWGYLLIPIDDLAVEATLEVIDNKYTVLVLDTETAGLLKLPLQLKYKGEGKERKPALDVLKLSAAFAAGDVSEGLETVRVMSQSMGKLPENTEWEVTAYARNAYGNDALLIEALDPQHSAFNGWYTADDLCPAQLSGRTELIGEVEVTLSIGLSRGKTSKGNNKASASLTFSDESTDDHEFSYL
jgi:hypothetical protein